MQGNATDDYAARVQAGNCRVEVRVAASNDTILYSGFAAGGCAFDIGTTQKQKAISNIEEKVFILLLAGLRMLLTESKSRVHLQTIRLR